MLLSLVGMILPLVTFPARLGLELARPSIVNLLYELVFYGLVAYIFHRRVSLAQLAASAGICLIYRLALGVAFGLLIAIMYSMEIGVSLSLGLSGYLPAILFHAAMTPFVLKPILSEFLSGPRAADRPAAERPQPIESSESGVHSVTASVERGLVVESPVAPAASPEPQKAMEPPPPPEPVVDQAGREMSGFDKAVCYIGEHASVLLAAVVDEEGLLLGNFARKQIDPETWAPLALLFLADGRQVLERTGADSLERLDMQLEDKRVVVARSEGCNLMVVSERLDDDLLNIRINQGLDMINRFVAERYGDKLNSNPERIHVSSAQ